MTAPTSAVAASPFFAASPSAGHTSRSMTIGALYASAARVAIVPKAYTERHSRGRVNGER